MTNDRLLPVAPAMLRSPTLDTANFVASAESFLVFEVRFQKAYDKSKALSIASNPMMVYYETIEVSPATAEFIRAAYPGMFVGSARRGYSHARLIENPDLRDDQIAFWWCAQEEYDRLSTENPQE